MHINTRYLLVVLCVWLVVGTLGAFAQTDQYVWAPVTFSGDDPEQRHESAFVAVGDTFYLIGGRGNKTIQAFDPVTNTWTDKNTITNDLHHFQAVAFDGKIYIVGAFTGPFPDEDPVANVKIYDPTTDQLTDGLTIPANRRRGAAGAVVYNDKIYVVSGHLNGHRKFQEGSNTDLAHVPWFDVYDPVANTWTPLTDAPRARDHFQAAVIGDSLYVAAGRQSSFENGNFPGTFENLQAEVDIYNFQTNTWIAAGADDIPTQRAGAAVATLGSEMIVIGGEINNGNNGPALAATEALETATGAWSVLDGLNLGRHASQAIVRDGKVYIAAGSKTRGGTEFGAEEPLFMEIFQRNWETLSISPFSRSESQTAYHNDLFYIIGGFRENILIEPTAETYNPTTDTWTTLGNLPSDAHLTHAGAAIVGDTIWLVGGRIGDNPGPVTSNVWHYKISTDSWTPGPAMPLPVGGGGLARVGRKLHWLGGFQPDAKCDADHHFVYDLDAPNLGWQDWSDTSPMPEARIHFGTVVLDGKIYTVGGQHGHDFTCNALPPGFTTSENTDAVHVYDPATDTWEELPSLPFRQSHMEGAAFTLDGLIYIVGGQDLGERVYVYDPTTAQWSIRTEWELPAKLLGASARIIDNDLYVLQGGDTTTIEPTDPARRLNDIERAPLLRLSFNVEPLTFVLENTTQKTSELIVSSTTGTASYTFDTQSLPAWLTLSKTSGDATASDEEVELTFDPAGLAAGIYNYTLSAAAPGYMGASVNIAMTVTTPGAPVLENPGSQENTEGDVVAVTVGVSNNTTPTFTAIGLPGGLTIDANTGEISGTIATGAAAASPYAVEVVGAANGANDTVAFVWTVEEPPAPVLDNPGAQENTEGDAVSLTVGVSNSTAPVFTASGLPSGLTIDANTGEISGTIAAGAAAASPYAVEVVGAANGANDTVAFAWTVNEPFAAGDTLYRINAGGPAVTTGGFDWEASGSYFSDGLTYTYPGGEDVANTTDDVLYVSEYVGNFQTDNKQFSFAAVVPNGTYLLNLHFAEIYWGVPGGGPGGSGNRVFSVDAEGQPLTGLQNIDLNAEVPPLTAVIKSTPVTVTDGTLNLFFSASVDQPKLSAIEIIATADANLPPVVANPLPEVVVLANAAPVALDLSNLFTDDDQTEPVALSVAGVSDPALLSTALDDTDLTLTFAPNAGGLSTVTVRGTDSLGLFADYALAVRVKTVAICDVNLPDNGLIVMEAESAAAPAPSWVTASAIPGATGGEYLLYQGQNRFGEPELDSVFTYTFRIEEPGTYRVQWRNRITVPGATTDHNDNWLRVNTLNPDDFYGLKDGGERYTEEKQSGFFKIYNNVPDAWSWQTTTKDFDPHQIYADFSEPGDYTLDISGRSNGHAIDRIVLYNGSVSEGFATNTNRPASEFLACDTLSGDTLYRINAGGPAVTTSGLDWEAGDAYLTGGQPFSNANASIANTPDDVLYQTEYTATDGTFELAAAVPDGRYRVIFLFAEIFWGAPGGGVGGTGQRVFSVAGEGQPLAGLQGIDLNAEVPPLTALSKSALVEVADGTLNLSFIASVDQPKLSAIKIVRDGIVSGQPPVVVNPLPDLLLPQGSEPVQVGLGGVFTDDDPANLAYQVVGNSNPGLVSTAVNAETLTLTFAADTFGLVDLVVRATDLESAFAQDTFRVRVNPPSPAILSLNVADGATGVPITISVSTDLINLPPDPNSNVVGIDNSTIPNHVNLYRVEGQNEVLVPSSVGGTGGGDAITLVPDLPLDINTQYRYEVTPGLKDIAGRAFLPFSLTFTTGEVEIQPSGITFSRQTVANFNEPIFITSLVMGPPKIDGTQDLYATELAGNIRRYPINPNGTLGAATIIESLPNHVGEEDGPPMLIGLAFDPESTGENPVAYITHSFFALFETGQAPDWTSKVSRLTGPDLGTVQDVVVGLPRSEKDHLINSIQFGPDGALYFLVGSNSSQGAPDATWANRPERVLTAAALRLDLSKLPESEWPLDAQTEEGGTYNPLAPDAPVTLYATGVRNAYDLVWHSNGQLYIPTNASAAGGNAPTSNPLDPLYIPPFPGFTYDDDQLVPYIADVNKNQFDWLFRVDPASPGGYYGHPNPARAEYVINRGFADVPQYGPSIVPDGNYRGAAYRFGLNQSPNGVIEYQSDTLGGVLKGKLIVARFSANKDLIVLEPGANFDITDSIPGVQISNFAGFKDPIDLVEDTRNGNIYVSEFDRYGSQQRIRLLRPQAYDGPGYLVLSTPTLDFGEREVGEADTLTLTLSNPGNTAVPLDGMVFPDNVAFATPSTLLPPQLFPGETFDVSVIFAPTDTVAFREVLFVDHQGVNSKRLPVVLAGLGRPGASLCSPYSTLPCEEITVPVADGYGQAFTADAGGLTDGNGLGTGFTTVDPAPNRNLADPAPTNDLPGYEPSLFSIDADAGLLTLTSSAGGAAGAANAQLNALGVRFTVSTDQSTVVQTEMLGLPVPAGTGPQAGLWFGLDQDNYVSLTVNATAEGTNAYEATLYYELNGTPQTTVQVIDVAAPGSNLELSLLIDPTGPTVQPYYNVNRTGFQLLGSPVAVSNTLIEGTVLPDAETLTPGSFAGIFATHGAGTPTPFAFSTFRIETSDAPLPVTLGSFVATLRDHEVDISWTTLAELNNDYFTVERSANGEHFTALGRISGAGTTNTPHYYGFTDRQPLTGVSYYRLRQTDFDGTEAFSPVRVIINNHTPRVSAYPNPNDGGELFVEAEGMMPQASATLRLIDLTGRTVLTKRVDADGAGLLRTSLDLRQKVQAGVYFLTVQTSQGRWQEKIVIR